MACSNGFTFVIVISVVKDLLSIISTRWWLLADHRYELSYCIFDVDALALKHCCTSIAQLLLTQTQLT